MIFILILTIQQCALNPKPLSKYTSENKNSWISNKCRTKQKIKT